MDRAGTAIHRQGWDRKLRLGDIWRNDALAFPEKRDAIVARIKRLPMYGADQDLFDIVDELADAEDADDFDCAWDSFYDWADAERVWVELWTPVGSGSTREVQSDG